MTSIHRGWFHLASGAGLGRALGFASNLLLSRWLGPTELGLFNLVTTTVQTSDTLSRCGGDYALNYELGGQPEVTKTERGYELARGLAQLCSLATLLICLVLAIWVWFGRGLFPSSLPAGQRFIMTILLLLMIACEGFSASGWEVLLVSHRTARLALRQGLFFPLRLLLAATGALVGGVLGAMGGWTLIAFLQLIWLKILLKTFWNPLQIWPFSWPGLRKLLSRGLPFYVANLASSIIFYPLLLKVANASGLSEIGYLRVGQILQQLFAFLPATLVPVLFLKLRVESSFANQVSSSERPLRIIWFLLLETLLVYCAFDRSLILWLFGADFLSALVPTRLLLMTALFECLAQIVVQPLLAAGRVRLYGFWQNGSALMAAVLGWLLIPGSGLSAYLIVRLLYVLVPLLAFGIPMFQHLHEPKKLFVPALASICLLVLFIVQSFYGDSPGWLTPGCVSLSILIAFLQRNDFLLIQQVLRKA